LSEEMEIRTGFVTNPKNRSSPYLNLLNKTLKNKKRLKFNASPCNFGQTTYILLA
jgi:hypothetical protein